MAAWKRTAIRSLLGAPDLHFARSAAEAVELAQRRGGAVAVWATREPASLAGLAREAEVPVARVEDGFIRSAGLGAECLPPASVVVDWSGLHFDPSRPSDLEQILAQTTFDPALLQRAERLIDRIAALGVTKYNLRGRPGALEPGTRRRVLVPGQVEDDLAFRLGGAGVASNLELLRRVRATETDAEIVYRPHPDVTAGLRRGAHPDADILRYADRIAADIGLNDLLSAVDAVHVLTSLTGFEALLRGREVVTHGQPFYAGWGLTRDLAPVARRTRRLSLPELAAGALILYPRYIDPLTQQPCAPEQLVSALAAGHGRGGLLPIARRLEAGARRAIGLAPPAMKAAAHG